MMTGKNRREKKSSRGKHRHTFIIKSPGGVGGGTRTYKIKARVKEAKTSVTLPLKAEHVMAAIALNGRGDSERCAMAVCVNHLKDRFPHHVDGADWTYNRAYIVSKRDKETGFPSEVIAYQHNDNVARLFDTVSGQKKLLEELRLNGDREITLSPRPKQIQRSYPTGNRDGSRPSRAKKAHLRFIVAHSGYSDPNKK